MEGFTPVILVQICTIFLCSLVNATLQIGLGALLSLYHESLSRHIGKKTKKLSSAFTSGSFILTSLMLASMSFIFTQFKSELSRVEVMRALIMLLIMLAVSAWIFYYRTRQSTELWLPRIIARYINDRAKKTDSNIEAFALGMLTVFAELPFSFALLIVAGSSVILLPSYLQISTVLLYSMIAVLPFYCLRVAIKHRKTLVDIQKWRVKNTWFFKFLTSVSFLILAIFLLAFKVL